MRTPYVGITGFTAPEEVALALRSFPSGPRSLMVGVLVSDRTLEDLPEEQHPRRHPPVADLPALFPDDPRAFNVVHFHTRTPEALAAQAERLISLAGPRLHGLQVNLHEIPAEELRKIRARHPGLALVLPLRSPDLACRFVEQDARLVDVALFDLSAGRGLLVDPDQARSALEKIEARMPGVALAVAGGLGPETVHCVLPLLERFPDLSLDAESRLRDAEDRLDPERVAEYVRGAFIPGP